MADTEIAAVRHGPLRVTGDFTLLDSHGHEIPCDEEVRLCRCGESDDKPFCDDSHEICGFRSDVRADE